ncbi:MAG: molybdenum cofactor guanylyltransferase [Mariprofundaceae bacterium]|nr:molybdenum cofactor guanylyltransferase [Mariprofundaceae bacterium]
MSSIQGVSCVILTGGESKRMGMDKAQILLSGKTLLERVLEIVQPLFDDVMISGRGTEPYIEGTRFIKDSLPGRGPSVGLCAVIEEARHPFIFAIACDMPFVKPELIEYIASYRKGFDIVVPLYGGKPEPLCAVYGTASLRHLAKCVEAGKRGLVSFIEQTPGLDVWKINEREIRKIDVGLQSFADIDSPEALLKAERMMEK